MRNPVTLVQRIYKQAIAKAKPSSLNWSVSVLLSLSLTAGWIIEAQAETPETAPSELKNAIAQIDAAANSRNFDILTNFYSKSFRNSDGLTLSSMKPALTQLWQRYSQLNYRTELKSWQNEGNAIVAETITYITGTEVDKGRDFKLESTLHSRQRFENEKIIEQEIISESTKITSGENPPSVEVNLPEQVRTGQQYNFDVIVKEPLGNDILLGAAWEEPIQANRYTKPADFELEVLPAGGVFKLGRAPFREGGRWLSAVLIRKDGMTMVTERLQFAHPDSGAK
ncbi:MAG: nuclear transport factor 2 family protein [Symploca sp. SIO3C6]|uniref:Nuclear transport factor 2 family protein n=1 Tax=Symploca sp. SIO1C4 TaxID=2607765 RepID=A0A6B3NE74_9CYAN|nr:nuclear transport factor 2 family protein [Symploca sp. SIO3C6]NER29887.1 nuclear transport factor 2 family protein [Symploca sp. SIO1C4]NET04359.1 nuclear transport factor 2 family protein [Symploca sp. SIO2B6]